MNNRALSNNFLFYYIIYMICIPVVCAPPRYSIISSLSSKWPGSIPFCLIWFSLSWTFKINVRHICSNFLFRCSVASCRFCRAVNFRMYSTDAFKIVPLFHLWSLKFFNVKFFWPKIPWILWFFYLRICMVFWNKLTKFFNSVIYIVSPSSLN